MLRRALVIRSVVVAALVAGGLGVGLSQPADADDPTRCGYLEYGKQGTTTTVTILEYCDDWTCGGHSAGPWPGGVEDLTWEVFVCTVNA